MLFDALEMSITSMVNGTPLHLHAEGLRGTGKTTIIRAARQILPLIRRVRGCPYNCDPGEPHCPEHSGLAPEFVDRIGSEWVPMPFLEISHSAKVGTVVGSIDLGRIVDQGRPSAALLPGTIPQANRGILFIDEVNRLADTAPELADILLDVMGTKPGKIQIEETGLPRVEIPVRVSVWAASNPDEEPGPLEDIRRQLSDRFDLVIAMRRPPSAQVVMEILSLGSRPAPARVPAMEQDELERLRQRLEGKAGGLAEIQLPPRVQELISWLYIEFSLESLRGVEAILLASRLNALLDGRQAVEAADVLKVAPLALQHRVDPGTLNKILQAIGKWCDEGKQGVAGAVPIPLEREEAAGKAQPGSGSHADDPNRKGNGKGLWDRMRETLQRLSTPQVAGDQDARPAEGTGGGSPGTAAAQGAGGTDPSLADPLSVADHGPPGVAVPIGQLTAERILRTEEDL